MQSCYLGLVLASVPGRLHENSSTALLTREVALSVRFGLQLYTTAAKQERKEELMLPQGLQCLRKLPATLCRLDSSPLKDRLES